MAAWNEVSQAEVLPWQAVAWTRPGQVSPSLRLVLKEPLRVTILSNGTVGEGSAEGLERSSSSPSILYSLLSELSTSWPAIFLRLEYTFEVCPHHFCPVLLGTHLYFPFYLQFISWNWPVFFG